MMTKLDSTLLTPLAAFLTITAGLITGVVLGSASVANSSVGTANRAHVPILAITIVAKRLSRAEKNHLARQEQAYWASSGGSLANSCAAASRSAEAAVDALCTSANVR
ncbi:MAG: hypothetical protein NVSMB6_20370 [Burkholderiaceae bacterium]